MSTLSATAQAAIDACGGSNDLRLRTELSPTVRILTSWMPCDRRYETLVKAPDDVYAEMGRLRMGTESWYATKAEAEAGHAQTVTRVGMLLQRMKPQAAPRTRAKRLCMPCDELVTGNPCPKCGADTEPWPAGDTL